MKTFLIKRLKEPSTWTALGAISLMFGVPTGTIDAVHMIVGGVLSLAGIFMPEQGHAD